MSADSYSSLEPAPRRSGGFLRVMLAGVLLALLAAAALIGWLVWEGRIALPITRSGSVIFRGPEPAPDPNVTNSQQPQVNIVLERQVAELERRLARIDLQAAAAEGNTARAEALLVALATRRAVERGAPLGYLEQQLRQRFGAARPAAVDTIIAAAQQPVTLVQLGSELTQLHPELTGEGPDQSAWARFRRQMSDLFVVHRNAPGTSNVETRLDQAEFLLRTGQVDAAADMVGGLPSRAAAADWIAKAKRYSAAMQALDQIEQAALAEPEKLKTGTGEAVRQPGPAVSPAAEASPEASPVL